MCLQVRDGLINMLKNKETEQSRDLTALQQDLERRMKIVDDVRIKTTYIFMLLHRVREELDGWRSGLASRRGLRLLLLFLWCVFSCL